MGWKGLCWGVQVRCCLCSPQPSSPSSLLVSLSLVWLLSLLCFALRCSLSAGPSSKRFGAMASEGMSLPGDCFWEKGVKASGPVQILFPHHFLLETA